MGWAESVSPNGMGRNGMDRSDIWAQIGRVQMGWAESGGHRTVDLADLVRTISCWRLLFVRTVINEKFRSLL
jgi:hypothetical protein